MAVSKQLRDKVLDIVKMNKDISFDDIVAEMMKQVGLSRPALVKLVGEILDWWEESGNILQMVDKRTRMGMYRMNENAKIAMNIVSESLEELGVEETLHEAKGILSVKPNSPQWRTAILTTDKNIEGAKGVTKLKKGDTVDIHPFDGDRHVGAVDKKNQNTYFFLAKYSVRESVQENASFEEIRSKGTKLGDWLMQSYFYYEGNIWMLKSGKATNHGDVEKFRKSSNRGLVKALEPKLSEVERMKEEIEESVDSHSARELQLYIENDRNIYRQRIQPIIRNLASKMKKGSFDEKLAVKAFMYAVEDGQKAYNKEFGDGSMKLDRNSKTAVAEKLLDGYREEIEQAMS